MPACDKGSISSLFPQANSRMGAASPALPLSALPGSSIYFILFILVFIPLLLGLLFCDPI